MTFACRRCGDCCGTMGEIISIQEQIRPFEFRIRFTNCEERIVTVDPDKQELFGDQGQPVEKSISCPFFRRTETREGICTIHASRPELCRSYACFRILILGPDGNKTGRVPVGTRSLVTAERALLALWDTEIRDVFLPGEDEWEECVEGIFTRAGYQVIR
ncbi:MAG: YkgJ family cysteine cluster protein [Methanoregula sp.]|nr:YkgJ family cysteine cluster protein [Methanoregula sp.]